jgi:hypothetical protein
LKLVVKKNPEAVHTVNKEEKPQCCGSRSGVGSGINHFGSGSGQPLLGMNLKQNYSDKIHNFSTKCTNKTNKNLFPRKA